jgi:CRP-like cAMP-binding protein
VKSETREALERSALLRFVPPDRRAELINHFEEQRFAFGEVIIRQGDEADAFFVITFGRARVVKKAEDGTELPLNVLKSGDEFGEAALLSQEKRSATIRASSTVEAAKLDRDRFQSVLKKNPELRRYLELSARWRSLHGFLYQFSNFGRLPAKAIQALV